MGPMPNSRPNFRPLGVKFGLGPQKGPKMVENGHFGPPPPRGGVLEGVNFDPLGSDFNPGPNFDPAGSKFNPMDQFLTFFSQNLVHVGTIFFSSYYLYYSYF